MSQPGIEPGPPQWEASILATTIRKAHLYGTSTFEPETIRTIYKIHEGLFESLKRILEISMLLFTLSHKNGKEE
jgi:hypothetical protein